MPGAIAPVLAAAVVSGALVAASAPADAAAHRPPWNVTIKASTTTLTLGQKVVLSGKVNRSAAGKLVVLQERHKAGATWKDQANALVHGNGHYQVSDRPSVNNRRSYRVVMPATKRHKKGVSKSVAVDVYQWTSLSTLPSVNGVLFDSVPSVSMNGETYPNSLEADVEHYLGAPTTESVEFNLNHRCTRFRGTFGLSDDSVDAGQATVTAIADGTPWFNQTFGLGESTLNEITFTTAPLKLRFESSSVIADSDGRGAVGTPEVYCEQ
jgi:hypothetical protein